MKIKYVEPELIIEINRKIIEEWNKRHIEQPEFIGVSNVRLDEVLELVKSNEEGSEGKEKIITTTAMLLGGIAWGQPFNGANKRTAILSATIFLRRNGLRFTIPSSRRGELRKMLYQVQDQRDRPHPETINKIILYIKQNITQL